MSPSIDELADLLKERKQERKEALVADVLGRCRYCYQPLHKSPRDSALVGPDGIHACPKVNGAHELAPRGIRPTPRGRR